MSLINFLALDDPGYGNFAKGILYVIYEIMWKLVKAIGTLIDAITGIFYKLAGLNYLGSGEESLVEETDLLSQIFNQNIISNASLFMVLAAMILMSVFGTAAVLKRLYFSKGEVKSTAGVIKNMLLAFLFLICLTPVSLFAISSISTIATGIASAFGSDVNVSLADVIINSSFNGDVLGAYNTIYGIEDVTSWTQMTNNDFLFELMYGNTETGVSFYWYICLLGGGLVLYNLVVLVLRLVKRIFMVIILYLLAPIYVAKMVDDGGNKFREWKNKALSELVSVIGAVVGFMILISLVGVINDLELVKEVAAVEPELGGELGIGGLAAVEPVETNSTIFLINNLAKVLLLVAGTAVAKDSGELLGNVFKGANDDSGVLLEGIFDRLGPKSGSAVGTVKNTQTAPRTRVITRNTTTTKRVIDYSQDIPVSSNDRPQVNVTSTHNNNINANISNTDRRINNIQNRANVSIASENRGHGAGVKVGNYKNAGGEKGALQSQPSDILNQSFTSYKGEINKLRNEWAFMKNGNSKDSKDVVKNFESASKDLEASISLGEQNKIKNSMNTYVAAYKKEEQYAKEGYKDFAVKSNKLSNDLSIKQQEELKKISTAYRKAQMDYGKTARRLSEVSQGNMSTSDALRIKEQADKQRAKLMEASSRANAFYNSQKKGE